MKVMKKVMKKLELSLKNNMHIGQTVRKIAKFGGGAYVIIAIVNCERCGTKIALRETIEPNKTQKKKKGYYIESVWCHVCFLYLPNKKTKRII